MNRTAACAGAFALVLALFGQASARPQEAWPTLDDVWPVSADDAKAVLERDRGLLRERIDALAPERPGVPDLYVLGVGGDSEENVFRNEVAYLETLAERRLGAQGRVLSLVNHRDSLSAAPRPLATLPGLRAALAGIARKMDREQDVLLLYMTMHGTREHELFVQMRPYFIDFVDPRELRAALDDAGIGNRVVVISACYAGGFIRALESPDTLVLTAARHNRPSFGCGSASVATYFGRAWLVEGLNATTDFAAAFEQAKTRIAGQEKREGFRASRPQIDAGDRIGARLEAWRATLSPSPRVPYPYVETEEPQR